MIKLSNEEKEILSNDEKWFKAKKCLKALFHFGDFYGAKELVNITGSGHLVLGFGNNGFEVAMSIFDDIIQQGFKTKYPFTYTWPYVFSSLNGLEFLEKDKLKKQALLEKKIQLTLCNFSWKRKSLWGFVLVWFQCWLLFQFFLEKEIVPLIDL